jgi:hypothetical protein
MIFKILIICGMFLVGYDVPDYIVVLSSKVARAPELMKLKTAISYGLITTGILFGFGL